MPTELPNRPLQSSDMISRRDCAVLAAGILFIVCYLIFISAMQHDIRKVGKTTERCALFTCVYPDLADNEVASRHPENLPASAALAGQSGK